MPEIKPREESLDQGLFDTGANRVAKQVARRFYAPYKMVLFTTDVFLICCAFFFSALVSGYTFSPNAEQQGQAIILLVMAMLAGSFFRTYSLYSYHLIFSIRMHIKNLCIALAWGALTILLIFAIYSWPQLINNTFFIPILFLLAMTMMLISRFFHSHILNILKVMGLSFLSTGFFSFINPETVPAIILNRPVLPMGLLLAGLLVVLGRYLLVHIVFNMWMRRQFRRQVIIIGSDTAAKDISNHVIEHNAPFWINGVVNPDTGLASKQGLDCRVPKDCLGHLGQLPDILETHATQEVIVTEQGMDKATLIALIEFCTNADITIWFRPELMPIIDIKLFIDNFCGIPMVRLNTQKTKWLVNKIKHTFDALVALPLFIVLLPVFAVIAMAIKLNSKGPVFYKATAIGKGAREFSMYKFRSMRVDTDNAHHKAFVSKLIKGEIDQTDDAQPLKIVDDPRITAVGRILRKLSLDELPQIINVLKGDMSLVGPRPCLPYEYEIYKDWHKKRTTVRPGITGLWQVAGRSEVEFDDMILLDLYYIFNHDLAMDFSTLYETIFVVLGRKGAY
jgi:exopolysaccharide biosynthesis polyprenyl glycosylphosphotransferase